MRFRPSFIILLFVAVSVVSASDSGNTDSHNGGDDGDRYGGNAEGHDSGHDDGHYGEDGNDNTEENVDQQVVECPQNWEYRCVLDLDKIHPKAGTAEKFCKGQPRSYVVDDKCHLDPGPLISANQCCRFG